MVTDPESYPLWRTRTPVIVVVNNVGESRISGVGEIAGVESFKYRYRYIVVRPGVETQVLGATSGSFDSSMANNILDGIGSVGNWENPFLDDQAHADSLSQKSTTCPYRTIEIDVSSTTSPTFGKVIPNKISKFTSDGVRIDEWNNSADLSFLPYLESLKAPNQALRCLIKKEDRFESPSDSSSFQYESDPVEDHYIKIESDTGVKIASQGTKTSTSTISNNRAILLHPSGLPKKSASIPKKRIFLVCYHLPVIISYDSVTGEYSAKFSESLLARTEQSGVSKLYEAHWVGTVSTMAKTEEEKEDIRDVLKPMNCTPLFFEEDIDDAFYYGMCKQVLWPAFHNIDLLDITRSADDGIRSNGEGDVIEENNDYPSKMFSEWDQSRHDGWWEAFCGVNQIFANTIVDMIESHDIVWVHDYHLVLLPRMLDLAQRNLTGNRTMQMVFFLHIPFPTSQVFRELEHGESILEGILHADVVGFHAFDHARHFLNASKRILGLPHESLVGGLIGVRYRGTNVLVTISNVSIESDVVDSAISLPTVSNGSSVIKKKHVGRRIIAGVDIAQGLSGVSLKLLAYERLLSDYPVWQNKVVLVQRFLIPGSRKSDEADTLKHVRYLVQRIQQNFGLNAIDYEEVVGSSLPITQRLALWSVADVFMSTPIREGLNLLPLEYVFSRRSPATPGVTITSEFSTISSILNGTLRVNPYDIPVTSTSLDEALSMQMQERIGRRERDITFVSKSPSGMWTRNVLRDLKDVTLAAQVEGGKCKSVIKASNKTKGVSSDPEKARIESQMSSTFLDFDAVSTAYKLARKRVILVDFNGTLVMKEAPGKYLKREVLGISGNKPPKETIEALTALCADSRNIVYVISGDSEKNIENALGDIPGLGLAAGNGGSIAPPFRNGEAKREWESFDLGIDWNAVKETALPILAKYTARANGSCLKYTSSSIGWSYYSSDPEWGSTLADNVILELEDALTDFDVRFNTLKGVVEVVPRNLNKGLMVKNILRQVREVEGERGRNFILCIGDDVSDEKMFTAVFSFLAESSQPHSIPDMKQEVVKSLSTKPDYSYAYTVTVGKKNSHASYYVDYASDVASLLMQLSGKSCQPGTAMSWDAEETFSSTFL